MAEYIEREALIAEYDRVHVGAPGGARKLMVNATSADVVSVVRCMECKHAKMLVDMIGDPHLYCGECHHREVDFDDYCSRAERKEQT